MLHRGVLCCNVLQRGVLAYNMVVMCCDVVVLCCNVVVLCCNVVVLCSDVVVLRCDVVVLRCNVVRSDAQLYVTVGARVTHGVRSAHWGVTQ
jgi:hypothetical protein